MKYNNSKFLLIGLIVLSLLICLGSINATNNTNTDTNTQSLNIDDNNIQDNYEIKQLTTKKTQKNSEIPKNTIKENKNKKTTANYEVNSYEELYNKIENEIKTSDNTEATIALKPGNYNITNTINWGNTTHTTKILTIKGQEQTLDGQDKYQFITVSNGYTLNIENITIQKCEGDFGGVINNKGNTIIKDSNFNKNHANYGGVNYNYGNMSITNSNFTNSFTELGGVNYNNGNMTISNSNFNENRADKGGVNYNYGNMSITNSNFTKNNAYCRGGVNVNYVNMNITNSNFTQNTATEYGGVNYNSQSNMNITNSNFTQNTATENGGVNYNSEGNMNIINSNFTQNTATEDGGVNYNYYMNMNITNCNFTQNNATNGGVNYNDGGSVFENYGNINITNSNFNENNATNGGVNYNIGNMSIINSNFTKNNAINGGVNYNNNSFDFEYFYYYSDMNITNSNFNENNATNGGVNYNIGNMNITNSNFNENNATNGGVNYNYKGTMTINGSNFTQNTATEDGGVNYNSYNSNMSITNSNFTKNNATNGGVNYNYHNSNMNITNCNFNENNAANGGVNYNSYNSNMNIDNSSFLNNFENNDIIIYSYNLFTMRNSSIINTLNPVSINTNTTIRSPIFISSLNSNEEIEFTLNNKTQTTTKNTINYYVQITDSFKNVGKQTVSIKYPSLDNNNTIKLEVPVKMGIQNNEVENITTIKTLENCTMNLIINDTNGNPIVGNLSCAVKINGITQLHTKTENEKLTFTLNTEKFSAKTYNITIVIEGNSLYNKGIITQTLVIENRPVNMEITTNTPKITENLDVNVKITENGNLVDGGFVIFKINGITLKDTTGQQIRVNVTDGYAKLNYTLPDTIGAGKYNITCVYNKQYYNARDTVSFTIEGKTILNKTLDPITYNQGQNTTLKLTVYDINGEQIKGKTPIAVKINGRTFNKEIITNGEINIVLETDTFKNPTYNITIIIGQTSRHTKAIYSMNLTKNMEKTVKTQLLSEFNNNDDNQTMKEY